MRVRELCVSSSLCDSAITTFYCSIIYHQGLTASVAACTRLSMEQGQRPLPGMHAIWQLLTTCGNSVVISKCNAAATSFLTACTATCCHSSLGAAVQKSFQHLSAGPPLRPLQILEQSLGGSRLLQAARRRCSSCTTTAIHAPHLTAGWQ